MLPALGLLVVRFFFDHAVLPGCATGVATSEDQGAYDFTRPVAQVARHRQRPDVWGLKTVRRRYFNFKYDDDDQVIDRWKLPKKLPPGVAPLMQPGSDLTN